MVQATHSLRIEDEDLKATEVAVDLEVVVVDPEVVVVDPEVTVHLEGGRAAVSVVDRVALADSHRPICSAASMKTATA